MQNVLQTLHEFLLAWLTNEDGFRDEHPDLKEAMHEHGYGDVGPEELQGALPLVAEDMPLDYQRAVYQYLNTQSTVDAGSTFNVQQGGAQAGNDVGAQGTAAVAASAPAMQAYPGEEPVDAAVRHIYNIQNNYSYIEDNDVINTVTAAPGSYVDFKANTATGDGAFAGDDNAGIVQGDNYGINAGDDVSDVNFAGGDNYGQANADNAALIGDGAIVGNQGAVNTGYVGGNMTNVQDNYDSAINVGDYGEANNVDVGGGYGEGYGEGGGAPIVNVGSGDQTFDASININDSFHNDSHNLTADRGGLLQANVDSDYSSNEIDVDLALEHEPEPEPYARIAPAESEMSEGTGPDDDHSDMVDA